MCRTARAMFARMVENNMADQLYHLVCLMKQARFFLLAKAIVGYYVRRHGRHAWSFRLIAIHLLALVDYDYSYAK